MNTTLESPFQFARAKCFAGLSVSGLVTTLNPSSPWDLALPATGVVGLCGPSGSGKSTLLAALAGQRACVGLVSFGGKYWQQGQRGVPSHQRNLSLGFQEGRLFAGQTVADNLSLAHRYSRRRLSHDERSELIEKFGIASLLEQPVERLSGGEVQRVALLRQLFSNAAVQLYDEPLSAIGRIQVIRSLLPTLQKFWNQYPALVLWTSHDFNEIQLLTSNCLWMENARLDELAPTAAVAQRLGHAGQGEHTCASRLDARVRSWESGILKLSLGENLLYADRVQGEYRSGQNAAFLINSDEISVSLERPGLSSVLNCIPATLKSIEQLQSGRVRLRLVAARQAFFADISRLSCERLALKTENIYFAQFKASSLAGL